MNDDFSQYKASNYKKTDDFSKYHASNYKKKSSDEKKEPSFLTQAGQYIKSDVTNLGKNLAKGYLNIGRNLANTPHRIGKTLGASEEWLNSHHLGNLAPEDFDYAKPLGLEKENENSVVQAIPEIGTAIALPGSTLPRMLATQSAFGATQNKKPLLGAAEGAGGVLAGTAIGKLLEKGINGLRPSKRLRGELSKEELAQNLENTKGTETGLGQVIESPWLQRLQENVLPHVIGSGAEKSMQRTAKSIEKKGEDILHGFRGGEEVHENYGERIKNALKESHLKTRNEKNAKFKKVNEIAEKENINTDRSNLRNEAKNLLKQTESDLDLAAFTNSEDINLLRGISKGTGKSSLKNTDILRGKIGKHAHEANIKGEEPKAQLYSKLKTALEKDVQETIEKSSSNELKNAHKEAMDYYKNEYAPYKDKDIQKFVKQGGDPDLILSHFLKMGSNDRVHLIRKLGEATKEGKKLSGTGGEQNILGNAYLSAAYEEGKLNPVKLSSLYHKLGKRQKVELFGKENNEKLKHYTDLVHKNKEGFNLMFNPKTGARLGHIGTVVTGATHLPAAFGLAGIGKVANKILTSESFREKLIKAMIADKKIKLPNATKALQKGSAITAGLSGNDKEQRPMELEVTGKRRK